MKLVLAHQRIGRSPEPSPLLRPRDRCRPYFEGDPFRHDARCRNGAAIRIASIERSPCIRSRRDRDPDA